MLIKVCLTWGLMPSGSDLLLLFSQLSWLEPDPPFATVSAGLAYSCLELWKSSFLCHEISSMGRGWEEGGRGYTDSSLNSSLSLCFLKSAPLLRPSLAILSWYIQSHLLCFTASFCCISDHFTTISFSLHCVFCIYLHFFPKHIVQESLFCSWMYIEVLQASAWVYLLNDDYRICLASYPSISNSS